MRARRARFTSLGGECSGALSGGGVSRSRGSPSKDQVKGNPGDARPERGDSGRGDAARLRSVKLRRPSDGRRFRGRASGWGVSTKSWGRRALTGVADLASILADDKGQPFRRRFSGGFRGQWGRWRLGKRERRRIRWRRPWGGVDKQRKASVLSRQRFAAKGRYLKMDCLLFVQRAVLARYIHVLGAFCDFLDYPEKPVLSAANSSWFLACRFRLEQKICIGT